MKLKKVIIITILLAASSLFFCYGKDNPGRNALFVDLTRSSLSWSAGGFGLTLGYEQALGESLSLMAEGTWMHLAEAPSSPRLMLASLGLRYYFSPPTVEGMFAGLQLMTGVGIENDEAAFLAGAKAELGYAWRIGKNRSFILEPYIQYPYFIGQGILIGIAPGLSLGYLF
jgi:hypothetical protein